MLLLLLRWRRRVVDAVDDVVGRWRRVVVVMVVRRRRKRQLWRGLGGRGRGWDLGEVLLVVHPHLEDAPGDADLGAEGVDGVGVGLVDAPPEAVSELAHSLLLVAVNLRLLIKLIQSTLGLGFLISDHVGFLLLQS
jgi:hypothetical protein